ncbi:GIY-YIG nuclease family protein [Massilia sp. LXY-6]|uniref:GIY-YIG nuclease family protein n=1 Tax=Massilia sp. LXY-6 TaxID=3379823 RepID=UPI003EE028B7
MDKSSYVYIMASEPYGTLYIGVTSDLVKRVWQHREGVVEGFTQLYGVKLLVWFEIHTEIVQAISREKRIKKWNRDWKVNLIQGMNPDWRDLYADIAAWFGFSLGPRLRGGDGKTKTGRSHRPTSRSCRASRRITASGRASRCRGGTARR